MIMVTKFSGVEVALNADLIETVEATPDTVISLTNGKKMMVKETVDEIVERVIEYKRRVLWKPEGISEGEQQDSGTSAAIE
jgi:flagellar protein FlbD